MPAIGATSSIDGVRVNQLPVEAAVDGQQGGVPGECRWRMRPVRLCRGSGEPCRPVTPGDVVGDIPRHKNFKLLDLLLIQRFGPPTIPPSTRRPTGRGHHHRLPVAGRPVVPRQPDRKITEPEPVFTRCRSPFISEPDDQLLARRSSAPPALRTVDHLDSPVTGACEGGEGPVESGGIS